MTSKPHVWVYNNDTQYFDQVLDFEEILHFQKIIVALAETDRVMREVHAVSFNR